MTVKNYNTVLTEANRNYTQVLDNSAAGNLPLYIGWAEPGTATSDGKWRIQKLTYDANSMVTNIQWSGGEDNFTSIWDNRAALSYS